MPMCKASSGKNGSASQPFEWQRLATMGLWCVYSSNLPPDVHRIAGKCNHARPVWCRKTGISSPSMLDRSRCPVGCFFRGSGDLSPPVLSHRCMLPLKSEIWTYQKKWTLELLKSRKIRVCLWEKAASPCMETLALLDRWISFPAFISSIQWFNDPNPDIHRDVSNISRLAKHRWPGYLEWTGLSFRPSSLLVWSHNLVLLKAGNEADQARNVYIAVEALYSIDRIPGCKLFFVFKLLYKSIETPMLAGMLNEQIRKKWEVARIDLVVSGIWLKWFDLRGTVSLIEDILETLDDSFWTTHNRLVLRNHFDTGL